MALSSRYYLTVLLSATLTGCQESTLLRSGSLAGSETLATSADVRFVAATPVTIDNDSGRIRPRQVICAEASPDVAKLASQALQFGGGLDLALSSAELPVKTSVETALALSTSRAEALAQLTQRLATVQLLRDGLYRACEAYANGAISDTTYAVMLSRYDDTMITMLASELAAGNFGGRMAALGTSASGGSAASLLLAGVNATEAATLRQTLAEKQNDLEEKTDIRRRALSDLNNYEGTNKTERDALASELEDAQQEERKARSAVEAAQAALDASESASARSLAEATHVLTGSGTTTSDQDRAKIVGDIQARYLESLNADALMVACISALDRAIPGDRLTEFIGAVSEKAAALENATRLRNASATEQAARDHAAAEAALRSAVANSRLSAFGQQCVTVVMPALVKAAGELIGAHQGREEAGKEIRYLEAAVDRIGRVRQMLDSIDDEPRPGTAGEQETADVASGR